MSDTYFMWTLEKLQEFWDDHISTLFARKSSVYAKTEIDTKTAALEGAMAVVQSTDTATVAISAGRYVIWKGSLCVASSAIAIGDTLSSSNLTAVSDGGLNALDASRISGDTALGNRIDSVISDIAIIVDGDTCSVAVPAGGYAYIKNNTHGLSEGLYKNTSGGAFPVSGGSATSSVFTAVPAGLGGEVTSLNSKLVKVTLVTGSCTCGNALVSFPGQSGQSLGLGAIDFASSVPAGCTFIALIPSQASRNDGVDLGYSIVPDNNRTQIRVYGTPNATYSVVARMLYS